MRAVEIELVGATYETNDEGRLDKTTTKRTILAEQQPVRQSEFYQAQAVGVRVEVVFLVWTFEYQDERELLCEGIPYDIVRTYGRMDGQTELVCARSTPPGRAVG